MNAHELKDLKQFIADLEIRVPRTISLPELEPLAAEPSGYVAGGSLVGFNGDVTPQLQSDVLNSTLLASLAADTQHDKYKETRAWYRYYREILANIGWVLGALSFTEFSASGGRFSVDRAVIDVLTAVASQNEMEIARQTLNALKNLSDNDGRVVLFERETHSLHQGNLQTLVASPTGNTVSLADGSFEFNAAQDITRILFWQYETATSHLYYSAEKSILNLDVYKQIREDVIQKLGTNAKRLIAKLPPLRGGG